MVYLKTLVIKNNGFNIRLIGEGERRGPGRTEVLKRCPERKKLKKNINPEGEREKKTRREKKKYRKRKKEKDLKRKDRGPDGVPVKFLGASI